MTQSPELAGGTGFNYEAYVSAFFMVAMIGEESSPALNHRVVKRVGVQQKAFGEPLDDVIVDACSTNGEEIRLSLQVKRKLVISDAASNKDFREIVENSWLTLKKETFRENIDRYGVATGTISESSRRELTSVCEYARASLDTQTFFKRFEEDGNAGKNHLRIVKTFRSILNKFIGKKVSDEDLHCFLKHFVLIKFDFLHEGATDTSNAVTQLRHTLAEKDRHRAPDLWGQVLGLGRDGAGQSAEFSRASLLTILSSNFQFDGAPSVKADLDNLTQLANLWLDDISTEIDGYHVVRQSILSEARTLLASHRFVQVTGFPGTGKSVLLRAMAKHHLAEGPILFLKADRLSGCSWTEFANSIDLKTNNIENLLSEIAVTGTSILFIDGIDRIQPKQRKIIKDLLKSMLTSQTLSGWHVLVTSRDVGIEPLRNWLPSELISEGIGTLNVKPLNDEEAEELANAKPSLRPLLFGIEKVRQIARRPFFASVLARGLSFSTIQSDFVPHSEVDLIECWWNGGGYQADDSEIYKRQHALEELAKIGARRFGLRIFRSELSPETIEILHDLISEEIISEIKKGIDFRFKHDIFFEWAYFYLLQSKDDQWINELIDAGEPPVLGRVVELLSQMRFSEDMEWLSQLKRIETSLLRSQWLRAWLLGPLGTPVFFDHSESFMKALIEDDFKRLPKVFVWFQAEKTAPNTLVLTSQLNSEDTPRHELIRFADSLGWPSDFPAWQRLISWTLACVDSLPCRVIPDIVSIFEVWQNTLENFSNPLSKQIVKKCMEWLTDIEDRGHSEEFKYDYGKWDKLVRDELEELETELRMIILRSSRSAQEEVKGYLERVTQRDQLRDHVFSDIMGFAFLLSQLFPDELIEFACLELKAELPEETKKRCGEEQKAQSEALKRIRSKPENQRTQNELAMLDFGGPLLSTEISHFDWDRLSIGRSTQGYFPSFPLREPFGSLFKYSPSKALDLVRDLTNHAMTAWLQLHNVSHEHRNTPIPLIMNFPWGKQEFWGNAQQYGWFRGWHGPQAVQCGLMALEDWAFREIDGGRDVDDVLKCVIEGHMCWSVLGIAIAITLETQHVSKTTSALLSCQRLWHIDIQRKIEESTGVQLNLIGFSGPRGLKKSERPHYEAIKSGNSKKCRKMTLRNLTPLFVCNHDEDIRRLIREALKSFPDNLPFSYEEEKTSKERVKKLRSIALLWAEEGKQENYSVSQNPQNEKEVIIEHENPQAKTTDFKDKSAQLEEKGHELSLWNWVYNTFENASLCSDLALEDAIKYAQQFDSPALFSIRSLGDSSLLLGAVSGVAAGILCFSDRSNQERMSWALDVISRAYETPEKESDIYSSQAIIPWHPCIFVARALSAEIRHGNEIQITKEKLLRLVAHPLEIVSLEALKCAFDLWDIDDRFSWAAIDLSMRISIVSRKENGRMANGLDDINSHEQSIQAVIGAYFDGQGYPELTLPPPAWVFAPLKQKKIYRKKSATESIWREPDEIWRWDYAPKVLKQVPIDKIMADPERQEQFLRLCDSLLVWTIDKLNPSWKKGESNRRNRNGPDLYEWRREYSQLLANVSGHLNERAVQSKFLDTIFEQEDELCVSFLAPFVSLYICTHVLDAKKVKPEVVKILESCLNRILKDRAFKHTGYRDGKLYGYDLPYLVEDLFFISVENADGATRFANGCWEEINVVMPIIDKFVRAAGWSPSVASAFLTLCERCGPCYPAEIFADQILAFWDSSNMQGWRGTTLPARIAGLIQIYADREHPIEPSISQKMLRILDSLVDLGDRRSAALQTSEAFRDVRIT